MIQMDMISLDALFVLLTEEEKEEEFLDSLPTDMVEDEDLQHMSAMARQTSFITRDLSSWYCTSLVSCWKLLIVNIR